MRNIIMIRPDPRLVSIPLEKAIYCRNCEMISTSAGSRCGSCGSERIIELLPLFSIPWDPDPVPAIAFAA